MAFHHVSMFRWKPETTAEQIAAVKPALDALATTIRGVEFFRCGSGLGLTPTSYDFAVLAAFEDKSAWEAYMADAEHERIRQELIFPFAGDRAGIQFEA